MSAPTITICIPTCRRPDFLDQVLRSCFEQNCKADRIIVGVDAPDQATRDVLSRYCSDVSLNVLENNPPLGQAGNVQRLISEVKTSHFCLIHDDDLLEKDAVRRAKSVFKMNPEVTAVFASQRFISHQGEFMPEVTQSMNRTYKREELREGLIEDSLICALVQQFPNDGYFVEAAIARRIDYRSQDDAGDACDWWFGLELAAAGAVFWFCEGFFSSYRFSEVSVLRGHSKSNAGYRGLRHLFANYECFVKRPIVDQWIRIHMPLAIVQAAQSGDCRRGFQWYFSKWHRDKILSLGGGRRLTVLTCSVFRSSVFRS